MIAYLLVLLIAGFSAWTVYARSLIFTPLIDYSYQIENAYRMYLGEMPYRDFFFVLPPGVYWILAVLMKLFGGYSHWMAILFMCGITFLIVLLTYALLRRIGTRLILTFVLLSLLVSGGHATVLAPNYDVAASAAIVASVLWFVTLWQRERAPAWQWFFSGVLVVFPFLFKQNIGVGYAIPMVGILGVYAVIRSEKYTRKAWCLTVSGAVAALTVFILWLSLNHALSQAYYQLLVYTRTSLDPLEPVKRLRHQYVDFFRVFSPYWGVLAGLGAALYLGRKWRIVEQAALVLVSVGVIVMFATVPIQRIYEVSGSYFWPGATILASTLFLFVFISGKQYRNDPRIYMVLPLLIAAQIPRGNYGMWPLAAIVVAWISRYGKKLLPTFSLDPFFIIGVLILSICLRYGTLSMWYVYMGFQQDGKPYTSSLQRLRGLSAPGIWVPNMEIMFRRVNELIPANDTVAFIPGEDPFYAYTNRRNPLPFVQMGPITYKNDLRNTINVLSEKKVRWVIVKTDVQRPFGYVDMEPYILEIRKQYDQVEYINNYLFFRRRDVL